MSISDWFQRIRDGSHKISNNETTMTTQSYIEHIRSVTPSRRNRRRSPRRIATRLAALAGVTGLMIAYIIAK